MWNVSGAIISGLPERQLLNVVQSAILHTGIGKDGEKCNEYNN